MRTLKNSEIDVRYLKHLGERGGFTAHWNIRANCQMRYYYPGLVSCPLNSRVAENSVCGLLKRTERRGANYKDESLNLKAKFSFQLSSFILYESSQQPVRSLRPSLSVSLESACGSIRERLQVFGAGEVCASS
jgi:hypothetical protein